MNEVESDANMAAGFDAELVVEAVVDRGGDLLEALRRTTARDQFDLRLTGEYPDLEVTETDRAAWCKAYGEALYGALCELFANEGREFDLDGKVFDAVMDEKEGQAA